MLFRNQSSSISEPFSAPTSPAQSPAPSLSVQPPASSLSIAADSPAHRRLQYNQNGLLNGTNAGRFGEKRRKASVAFENTSSSSSSSSTVSLSVIDHDHDLYSMQSSSSSSASLSMSERELMETEVIKALIVSYFNIVRKTIADMIPKAIMAFLVNHSKQRLQSELVKQLYQPAQFEQLLREADDVSDKRQSCMELLAILNRALEIINNAREYNVQCG